MKLKAPEEYGYVVKDGFCLFQKGPLSQWWGGFSGQESSFRSGIDSPIYNCAEQFMMAAKAVIMGDNETADKIIAEKNPAKHKDLGRQIKNFDSELWNKHKFMIVFFGNYFKFSQNGPLREFLLSFPKETIFAEAAPWDKIWGIGLGPDDPRALDIMQWQGENLLGEAIGLTHYALRNDLGPRETFAERRRSIKTIL